MYRCGVVIFSRQRLEVANQAAFGAGDATGDLLTATAALTASQRWNYITAAHLCQNTMQVIIRRIGNSQGTVIPKPLLAQLGLDVGSKAEVTVEGDALVLRRAARPARAGLGRRCSRNGRAGR
jgi:antitoxin MazE